MIRRPPRSTQSRSSAASDVYKRQARDPQMTLSDVQWVLGHAQLSTTQLYLTAPTEDVIAAVLAYHDRRAHPQPESPDESVNQLRYRPETLSVLFGREPR